MQDVKCFHHYSCVTGAEIKMSYSLYIEDLRDQMPYSLHCSTIALLGYVLRSELTTLIYRHIYSMWREDRVCKECGSREMEDVGHFVLRCEYVAEERERMERLMGEEEGWYEIESNEKEVMMMD